MKAIVLTSIILHVFTLALAYAEVKQPGKNLFTGKKASAEIQDFMNTRWHRQSWQIEYKAIGNTTKPSKLWHVKGTIWWVDLAGPKHLQQHLDLSKLDQDKTYEFVGLPVSQNFGVITFYLASAPKPVAALEKNN